MLTPEAPGRLCGWLPACVRDGAYQLLGVLASWGPDSAMFRVLASHQGAQIMSLLWEHLPHLEPRHLRSFIRLFFGHLIRNCPPHLHPGLLQGTMPQVLGLLRTRLDEGYASTLEGKYLKRRDILRAHTRRRVRL